MKKISLLVLFFLTIIINAQDISVNLTKSEIYKDKKKHTNLLYSENDGNGGLIVVRNAKSRFRITPKEYYIEHYNKDLKLISKFTLENKDKGTLRGIIVKDNKINLIQLISKKGNITVNRLESSVENISFSKTELFSLNKDMFNKYFGILLGPIFINNGIDKMDINHTGSLYFSTKKNYMTFTFDVKDKENESHLFLVYDNNFKKIYENVFTRNIKDKFFDLTDVSISDTDASVYLLGKVFENESRRTKKKKKTNYHYELYKINQDEQKEVSFKNNEFVNSLYVLQKENKLFLVGFYSEKNDYRTKGVCRFNLAPDLTIKDKQFNPFSDQFFEDKYKKGKDVKDRKKEIHNIDYRGVFLDEDDSIIINAEEFYITTSQTYVANGNGGGHWTTVTTYHFDDIITTKMDSNGKLLWARNINKRQIGLLLSSYTSTIVDGKVYFVLNATDNIKVKKSGLTFGGKLFDINLYIFSISNDGKINYKKLIDKDDLDVKFMVKNGVLSDDLKTIYIQGRKRRKKQFIKLEIK